MISQWKCPMQNENEKVAFSNMSKMKFQAWDNNCFILLTGFFTGKFNTWPGLTHIMHLKLLLTFGCEVFNIYAINVQQTIMNVPLVTHALYQGFSFLTMSRHMNECINCFGGVCLSSTLHVHPDTLKWCNLKTTRRIMACKVFKR